MQIRLVSDADTAKGCTSAAEVLSLQGDVAINAEFSGMHLMLDAMRVYIASNPGRIWLHLVPRAGGFALFLQVNRGIRVWLIAERTKRVRIFKRVETAFSVCCQLDARRLIVLLDDAPELQSEVGVSQ